MSTRLYHVHDKVAKIDYLVEAATQAQALHKIAEGQFTVQAASALEAATLMAAGAKVRIAAMPPAPTPTPTPAA